MNVSNELVSAIVTLFSFVSGFSKGEIAYSNAAMYCGIFFDFLSISGSWENLSPSSLFEYKYYLIQSRSLSHGAIAQTPEWITEKFPIGLSNELWCSNRNVFLLIINFWCDFSSSGLTPITTIPFLARALNPSRRLQAWTVHVLVLSLG